MQEEAIAIDNSALIVQGNLSTEKKGIQEYFTANLDLYRNLSVSEEHYDFIVWPESVASQWYNADRRRYDEQSPNPFPNAKVPLLYGGLSYQRGVSSTGVSEVEIYNSALLKEPFSDVSELYSKRILMPFGEYVPFTNYFPWIRNLTPIKKDFNIGKNLYPISIQVDDGKIIKAGVSICYEDLSAEINRGFVKNGAQVLINLTNDAWYGDTPAPFQHDLLARQRAIESRRYLLRSTNTGLTSLISSRGERIRVLPLFTEASEVFNFKILDRRTMFVEYGYTPLYLVLGLTFFSCLVLDRRRYHLDC